MAFVILSLIASMTLAVSTKEKMSYVVTSKPYYIQMNDNVNKLQRDFNPDNVGENEINETKENNIYTDCEQSDSCGNEDTRAVNFDATFKPFPQDELEKILRKYGKDKNMSEKLPSSNAIVSTLSFQPVTTENSVDKSKSWSLLTAETNTDPDRDSKDPDSDSKDLDRVGWVTLEPVAWSTSQVQKWKPSIQSIITKEDDREEQPWKNKIVSKPSFDSFDWNPNKHPWHSSKPSFESHKPDYEFEKPTNIFKEHNYKPIQSSYEPMKQVYDTLKPTYDPLKPMYESLKPTYDPIQPTRESIKPAYHKLSSNPIKPTLHELGLTYDSSNHHFESIKTNPDFGHKPYWNTNQNYEANPSVNKVQSSWNSHGSLDSMPQIITSHNQHQFASYQQAQQEQHRPAGMLEESNQISMQGNDYGAPGSSDGHWVLLSSTREHSAPDRQISRSLKRKDFYRKSIPLTITALNPESNSGKVSLAMTRSNSTKLRRKAIPFIVTPPDLNQYSDSGYKRHERKLEATPTEETSNFRSARRMVRLTVLPPVNGSNIVTSHNGMIEVENTKLTVDESHREHLARMMKLEQQGSRMQRDTMSFPTRIYPVVIGRRRRRYEPSHVNILTATH